MNYNATDQKVMHREGGKKVKYFKHWEEGQQRKVKQVFLEGGGEMEDVNYNATAYSQNMQFATHIRSFNGCTGKTALLHWTSGPHAHRTSLQPFFQTIPNNFLIFNTKATQGDCMYNKAIMFEVCTKPNYDEVTIAKFIWSQLLYLCNYFYF